MSVQQAIGAKYDKQRSSRPADVKESIVKNLGDGELATTQLDTGFGAVA